MPDLPKFPKLEGRMGELNISQKKLSELVTKEGVRLTQSSLSNKLKGDRKFFIPEMEAIAKVLDSDPVTLFFTHKYT